MMRCRIVFCVAVFLAILLVILLSFLSPSPIPHKSSSRSWFALSLYIQQPQIPSSNVHPAAQSNPGAFIFHRILTEGPENTSRTIGKAQGFIIPIQHFADSAFNIIHLTFDTPRYSGTLSAQAKHIAHKDREELEVVGGTGYFAFARGLAVFTQTDGLLTSDVDAAYQIKLQLRFPDRSQTIPV
ncbi:hypothetical protein JCGZ_04373 [Jatropha curcas]|uniref:Dirigent protein n=1 Tax=Jatropha curcas TaxID=180498 RepID=A0A067KTY7_JATCU|nr:dirigent protein 11 [Jatropha curcas]KDP38448.1 hypothetical protein JCGZ_04373 [Jatropha curcas]